MWGESAVQTPYVSACAFRPPMLVSACAGRAGCGCEASNSFARASLSVGGMCHKGWGGGMFNTCHHYRRYTRVATRVRGNNVCMCVCMYVCACVRVCVCVFACGLCS